MIVDTFISSLPPLHLFYIRKSVEVYTLCSSFNRSALRRGALGWIKT